MYGDYEDQGFDYQRFLPQAEDASNAIFNRGGGLLSPVRRKPKSFLGPPNEPQPVQPSGGAGRFFGGIHRAFSL